MTEYELVEHRRSAPSGERKGPSASTWAGAVLGLAGLVAAVSLLFGSRQPDAPQPGVPLVGTSIAERPATTSGLSNTAPSRSDESQSMEQLLASFDDQVIFLGVGVDDPDQVPEVFAILIATGEQVRLPISGDPLAVVDNWLLVQRGSTINAVGLGDLEADPPVVMERVLKRPRVELLPGAVRLWNYGALDEPVTSATFAIGSWAPVETPADPPRWANGHEVFDVPGAGTYLSFGDHFELISPGRLVAHNRDYLVIEECETELNDCRLVWLSRPSLDRITPSHDLGPVETVNLLPRGGVVSFGVKVVDIVGGDRSLVLDDGEGLDSVLAWSDQAALIRRGRQVLLVDLETHGLFPVPLSRPIMTENNTAVRLSDYPSLKAAFHG